MLKYHFLEKILYYYSLLRRYITDLNLENSCHLYHLLNLRYFRKLILPDSALIPEVRTARSLTISILYLYITCLCVIENIVIHPAVGEL